MSASVMRAAQPDVLGGVLCDAHDLRRASPPTCRSVDADHLAGTAVGGEADDHPAWVLPVTEQTTM